MQFRGFTGLRTYNFVLQRDLRSLEQWMNDTEARLASLVSNEPIGIAAEEGGTTTLAHHAFTHATTRGALYGADPIDVYEFDWKRAHTWTPSTDSDVPVAIIPASTQTANLLNIYDVSSNLDVQVDKSGQTGFGVTPSYRVHIRDASTTQLRIDFDSNSYLDFHIPNVAVAGDSDTPAMSLYGNALQRWAQFPSGGTLWTLATDGVTEAGQASVSTPNSHIGITMNNHSVATPTSFRSDFGHNVRGGFCWSARTDTNNTFPGWTMFYEPLEAGATPAMSLAVGVAAHATLNQAATTPPATLTVQHATLPQVRIQNSDTNYTDLFTASSTSFKIIPRSTKLWLVYFADTTKYAEFNIQNDGSIDFRTIGHLWYFSYDNTNYVSLTQASSGKLTFDCVGTSGTQEFEFLDPVRITKNAVGQLILQRDASNITTFTVESDGDLLITPAGTSVIDGVGINTSPAAKLHVLSTTEQLRLSFDGSNQTSFTVSSVGRLTIDAGATGTLFTDPVEIFTTTTPQFKLSSDASNFTTFTQEADGDLFIAPTGTGAVPMDVGINVSPSAALHVLKTTEQLRLAFDASNYTSFTVASTGALTIAPIPAASTAEVKIRGFLTLSRPFDTPNTDESTPTILFQSDNDGAAIGQVKAFGKDTGNNNTLDEGRISIVRASSSNLELFTVQTFGGIVGQIGMGITEGDDLQTYPALVNVLHSTGTTPQLSLHHTNISTFSTFRTDSSGDLNIIPSGDDIKLYASNSNSKVTTFLHTTANGTITYDGLKWVFAPARIPNNRGTALPTADAAHVAELFVLSRQASAKGDILYLCVQLGAGTYNWLKVAGID